MSDFSQLLPRDEYNDSLLENVRPPQWRNPRPARRYDLVVIGAGTAGLVCAAGAAGLGAKVALVERYLLGGDCLNVGCVPSKAIIRSSRVAADVRDARCFGVRVPDGAQVDFAAVMRRMRRLRSRLSHHDSVRRFRELGVDVFLGQGRFADRRTLLVGGESLPFKKAVIATGARAVCPAVDGLAQAGFLTNETVFSLTKRPARLAVIGGGPLGCELSQALCRLGSQVSILHNSTHLLNREDADAAQILQRKFIAEGVRPFFSCRLQRVSKRGREKVICFESEGRKQELVVDEILVGAGRAPNVEGLNLEAAGVRYDKRAGVKVNDFLQTSNARIYAAGDVCLRYKFTHLADASARIVIQNALFLGRKKVSALTVPWCTYTDPEIAHVGIYEKEAEERGIPLSTFKKDFSEVDRAVLDGEEDGFVKLHLRRGSDRILGATIVARHAGEMISEITLAITARLGLGKLAGVIHPYPTQAEAIRRIADDYNRARLTPFLKKLFSAWLSW